MRNILIFFLITSVGSWSQSSYLFPEKKDSTGLISAQFNFNKLERLSTNLEKAEMINELIRLLDTSSVYFFTGFDKYFEFQESITQFAEELPIEFQNNIHAVQLNADSTFDFIYDRLNFQWDQQSIFVLLRREQGWKLIRLPGAIIVKLEKDIHQNSILETYQWACCDFPYDAYYHCQFENDSVIQKSSTARSRFEEGPREIDMTEAREIQLINQSHTLYAYHSDKMIDFYSFEGTPQTQVITEKIIQGEFYYFVRINLNLQTAHFNDYDYILGWLHESALLK